jgi:hypothetical protein
MTEPYVGTWYAAASLRGREADEAIDCAGRLWIASLRSQMTLLSSPYNTDPIDKIFKTSLTPRHHDGSCPRRKQFGLASAATGFP